MSRASCTRGLRLHAPFWPGPEVTCKLEARGLIEVCSGKGSHLVPSVILVRLVRAARSRCALRGLSAHERRGSRSLVLQSDLRRASWPAHSDLDVRELAGPDRVIGERRPAHDDSLRTSNSD